MIALLGSEASNHSILIDSDFSLDLPPIMADRVQLQQIDASHAQRYRCHEEHEHAR
jgi:hypothetical protein